MHGQSYEQSITNLRKISLWKNDRTRTKWLRINSWQEQNQPETKGLNGQNEI